MLLLEIAYHCGVGGELGKLDIKNGIICLLLLRLLLPLLLVLILWVFEFVADAVEVALGGEAVEEAGFLADAQMMLLAAGTLCFVVLTTGEFFKIDKVGELVVGF